MKYHTARSLTVIRASAGKKMPRGRNAVDFRVNLRFAAGRHWSNHEADFRVEIFYSSTRKSNFVFAFVFNGMSYLHFSKYSKLLSQNQQRRERSRLDLKVQVAPELAIPVFNSFETAFAFFLAGELYPEKHTKTGFWHS